MQTRYYIPEIELMPRKELEKLQLERLKWQVQRCYDNSEFYRKKFDKVGLKPEHIKSLDDVIKIPVVTKTELRQEQIDHPPFGRYVVSPKRDWRELHPSTGTTGIPVNTIWTQKDVDNITQWTARNLWSFGVRGGDILQNSYSYGLWVAGMSIHYGAKQLGCFVLPIGATQTERQIQYFQTLGSTVLLATPSYALYLAEKMRQIGISPEQISLRVGAFGGEPGVETAATRKKIEEGLGIDAYNNYGLAEIGPNCANECEEKAGLHWAEDHILVETINKDTGRKCVQGETGILVLTNLTKEATPLLRYWTNDYARLDFTKCACGRTHVRAVGGVLGRADDMLMYKGENFYPIQVEKVVRSFAQLSAEYKIRIETDDRSGADVITVVAECIDDKENTEELKDKLKRALREELIVTPEVALVKLGTIERTELKAKRIEDRRKKEKVSR